ncbi:hypothetical protein KL864_31915 [Mycolicibacterium goodii]|uniref:hypothetical protein n=1 Tax=Mycolicibacterium goodii TaxID=134601 RepID=UPI001BDD5DC3|nr:hypothetical protein [Mycolicibacterium goodii]MBU8820483.1 hypothetical protein [Mycolicibacterium goodii]
MGKAVLLPSAAMGGYAGLRVAAKRSPAFEAALRSARSASYRDLLRSTSKAPSLAGRQAAGRGAAAASRALASTAAKQAPQLLAKAGMMTLGRVALAPLPVVGQVVLAATWLFDKDSRSLVNGLISCIGGVGFPPDGDAPPSPPRTQFLPLTGDGNRDPEIEKIDQGMTQTNAAAFNYAPDEVWPSTPAIETTPDFKGTVTALNKLGPKASEIADSIRNVSNSLTADSTGQLASSLPAKLGPLADALDEYRSAVVPGAASAVNGVTAKANELYQKFREINNGNRTEIANSASGLIPFTANHVNVAKMDDSVSSAKAAANEISKHNAGVTGAFSNWSVPTAASSAGASTTTPVSSVNRTNQSPPPSPTAPVVAEPAQTPPAPQTSTEPTKSPLDGLLSSIPPLSAPGIPGSGGIPMPSLPTMPSSGPFGPDPGLTPMGEQQPLDDHKDPENNEKEEGTDDNNSDHTDQEDRPNNTEPVAAATPGTPGAGPAAPAPPPGADRTVRIGNKDYVFDSPRIAAAIRQSYEAAQAGPGIPIPQTLADNGYTIPPVGQPIGQSVNSITDADPGAVIVSNNGAEHAYYLGNGEALTE